MKMIIGCNKMTIVDNKNESNENWRKIVWEIYINTQVLKYLR